MARGQQIGRLFASLQPSNQATLWPRELSKVKAMVMPLEVQFEVDLRSPQRRWQATSTSSSSSSASAQHLVPMGDVGKKSADNFGRISLEDLEPAIELAKAAAPGAGSELRQRVLASFQQAIPQLLDRGCCVATALKLPLEERWRRGSTAPGAERPVKDLLLKLARQLPDTASGTGGLRPSELPQIPALLQRVALKDHALWDDFCAACGKAFPELEQRQLTELLRGSEDYQLLHGKKGTALNRVVAALQQALISSLEPLTAAPSCASIAALVHAALSVKNRAACSPLLETLRGALQVRADSSLSTDAALLLAAAGELHAAIGMPLASLRGLITLGHQTLMERTLGEIHSDDLAAFARASCRCYWASPEDASNLFEALIPHLKESSDATKALHALRRLPGSLRRRLVERLYLQPQSAFQGKGSEALEASLMLMHDLPCLFAEDAAAFASLVEACAKQLLEGPWKQALSASTLSNIYLATASAAHGAQVGSLSDLSNQALKLLDGRWSELGPLQVQTLFRSPGDVEGLLKKAAAGLDDIKDPGALAALLQVLPAQATLAAAASNVLQHRMLVLSQHGELSAIEAALRKGPSAKGQQELRKDVRGQLFRSVLLREPTWWRGPSRDYLRYVQRLIDQQRSQTRTLTEQKDRW